MTLSAKASNFDVTIHDANGVTGVKDGIEYQFSREEWEKENPRVYHKDTNCTECSFVSDVETLLVFNVPREQKAKATYNPEFVGKYTMPGWTGHSGFYLFRCQGCDTVCVDYPGYLGGGLPYLKCEHCNTSRYLRPKEERSIYENEGIYISNEDPEERRKELQKVIEEANERGIRVIVNGQDFGKERRMNIWTIGLIGLILLTGLIASGVL